ncbi:MAG: glycosyltransferase family 4 protein, partial [Actinobacteria bacterium]
MRIAILAPPWFPVPPSGYGGIEWVVAILADALADAGHDVTLFASGDSRTRAKLSAVYAEAPRRMIGRSQPELHHVL